MNANELADELEDALDTDSWCQECALETTEPVARQAATMLRQQQAKLEKSQALLREYTALNMRQQAEIEALKLQLHTTLTNRNLEKPVLTIEEVMSENCTCYKLGYSPLNDYASVKQK